MEEEFDEFGIPINNQQPQETDEFGIPINTAVDVMEPEDAEPDPPDDRTALQKGWDFAGDFLKLKKIQATDAFNQLKTQSVETLAGLAGVPNFVNKMAFTTALELSGDEEFKKNFNALSPEKREEFINNISIPGFDRTLSQTIGELSADTQDSLTDLAEELRESTIQYETNIWDDIATGNLDQAAARVVGGVAGSAPSLAMALIPGGVAAIGASSASQRQEELEREGEAMEANTMFNSLATGGSEFALETVTAGLFKPLRGIIAGDRALAQEFSEKFVPNMLKAMGFEGASEGVTTISQQMADDLFLGREPGENFWKTVFDSWLIGTFSGLGISATTVGASKYMTHQQKEQVRKQMEQRQSIAKELNNENIPPELQQQLRSLDEQLQGDIRQTLNNELQQFTNLSEADQQRVVEIDQELENKKSEQQQIEQSDLEQTTKDMLLKSNEAEAKTLWDEKNALRDQQVPKTPAEPTAIPEGELPFVSEERQIQIEGLESITDESFTAQTPQEASAYYDTFRNEIQEDQLNKFSETKVLNPDDVREAFAPIGYDKKNTPMFREANIELVTDMYQKILDDPSFDQVTFLAGPAGSGKSTAASNLETSDKNFTFDAGFNSFTKLDNAIETAKSKGKKINLVPVYNDPTTAYKNTIERGLETGRFVNLAYFVDAFAANEGKLEAIREKHPDIEFNTVDNTNNQSRSVSIDEAVNWDYDITPENIVELFNIIENEPRLNKDQLTAIARGLSRITENEEFGTDQVKRHAARLEERIQQESPGEGREESGPDGEGRPDSLVRLKEEPPTPPETTDPDQQPTPEGELSGIKLNVLPEDVLVNTPVQRRTFQEVLSDGQASIDNGVIEPISFIQELVQNPRALQPTETAAMVYYKAGLDNRLSVASSKLNDAYKGGIQETINNELENMSLLNKELDDYHIMARKTGYEQGQALAVRQMLLNNEYELSHQISQYRANNKGVPNPEVEAKFAQYDQQIKELNRQIQELESQRTAQEGNIDPVRKRKGSIRLNDQEQARLAELRKKFLGTFNDVTRIATLMADPEFWEYARLVLKQAAGDFQRFAQQMINALGKEVESVLPEIYRRAGGKGGTRAKPKAPTMDNGILSIPNSMVRSLVEEGFDTIESLTNEAHRIVSEYFPEVTIRQVRDLITDYGRTVNLSKNEIDVRLREIRRVGRLISSLEDVQQGIRPRRSGLQRDKPTQRERDLMRQIRNGLRDIPVEQAEIDQQWNSLLEATKQRYRNKIEDLQAQIERRERTPNRPPLELDAEAITLRDQVRELQNALDEILGDRRLTDADRVRMAINQAQNQIEFYNKRIADQNFEPLVRQPVPVTPELAKLRQELETVRSEYRELRDASIPEDVKQERANERALKALLNRAEKLEQRILNKELVEARKTRKAEDTPQIEAARRRIDELNSILTDMQREAGIIEQREIENYKKNLQRSIDNYKQRIVDGDFAPRKVRSRLDTIDEDIRRLEVEKAQWKNRFDVEQIRNRLANRTLTEKVADNFVDVLNMPRSLMASADFSAPLRQGAILSAANPRAAARAFKVMFQHTFSQKAHDKWLAELQQSPEYVLMQEAKLYIAEPSTELTAREEQFMSRLASKWAPWVGISERAYTSYLNKMRVDVFTRMVEILDRNGHDARQDIEPYRAAANFVNDATGRGQLHGALEKSAPLLNALMFSPRYLVSRFNLLNPYTYVRMPKHVRHEALRTMGTYVGVGMTILGIASLAGADVEEDPRSSDFGKIKVGNTRFDIWAGFQQWARLFAQLITGERKSTTTGEIKEINAEVFPFKSRYNLVLDFLRSKMSPIPSTVIDFLDGKDIVGNPFSWSQELRDWIMPLYLQDLMEVYNAEGTPAALAVLFPSLFGIGVQNYNDGSVKEAKEQQEEPQFDTLE